MEVETPRGPGIIILIRMIMGIEIRKEKKWKERDAEL
jgi:hypothetical protein